MSATRRPRKPSYDTSVFINCPFDTDYRPLFRALVFVIEYCEFAARCALEVDDSGETRSGKIIRLIEHGARTKLQTLQNVCLPSPVHAADVTRHLNNNRGTLSSYPPSLPCFYFLCGRTPYACAIGVDCFCSGHPGRSRVHICFISPTVCRPDLTRRCSEPPTGEKISK